MPEKPWENFTALDLMRATLQLGEGPILMSEEAARRLLSLGANPVLESLARNLDRKLFYGRTNADDVIDSFRYSITNNPTFTTTSAPKEPMTAEEVWEKFALDDATVKRLREGEFTLRVPSSELDKEYGRNKALCWIWSGEFREPTLARDHFLIHTVVCDEPTPTRRASSWRTARYLRRLRRSRMLKDVRRRKRQWPEYPLKKALIASVSAGEIYTYYGCRFVEGL